MASFLTNWGLLELITVIINEPDLIFKVMRLNFDQCRQNKSFF